MNKEILAELRKVEQELAKLSKLKATKTTKQRQLKLTRRKVALQGKLQKPKEEIKPQKAKAASSEVKATSGGKASSSEAPKVSVKVPKINKPRGKNKKQRKKEKQENKKKKQARKKKKPVQTEPLKTIPFGTLPDTGEVQVSEPMSLVSMLVTGIVDRIEQALDGRSELVTVHSGEGSHINTAEYNGTFISARSYYHRLDVAARSTVLIKVCEEAKKEADLINANDEGALKAFKDGNLLSNILISKQSEILSRLFKWVFDSEQDEDGLSSIDALFPFTEAFGGTKYEAELNTALDEAANEDMNGGIEREEYNPKDTFIGYTTGREFVILPDDTIQPINDSNIKFEKGSDGLYEIGGKKYTLKEAIERL
jgi:hypothetical protein